MTTLHSHRKFFVGIAACALFLGAAQAQDPKVPAARAHVKMVDGVPTKFTTKLKRVVELNFTFNFHHQDSKNIIAGTLKRIADTTYAIDGVPAFTIQRHVGPANNSGVPGTASGLPTPDFTVDSLLQGQVIFANQISAFGSSTLGATRRSALEVAIRDSGRGYFGIHGSGDDQTSSNFWQFFRNTLHPMNYQGHGDRTLGPVYKNPAKKDHIVTENVLVTGMTGTKPLPVGMNGSTPNLQNLPYRNIRNEWYYFGRDIRTDSVLGPKVTVLTMYASDSLTAGALPNQYRNKGGHMYTYIYQVGNGRTHYLPAGHDSTEINATGGFDGKVGDWDRYFAQVLFYLAGYDSVACDSTCKGLPIVTADDQLTGTIVSVKNGHYRRASSDLRLDANRLAFEHPTAVRYDARVLDASGKVVRQARGFGNAHAFSTAGLANGVYLMTVKLDGMVPASKRYVVASTR